MPNEVLEQEIAALEKALEEKRSRLEQTDTPQEMMERDTLHEIIGDQLQQHSSVQQDDTQAPEPQDQPIPDEPDAVVEQVQGLVNTAFEKSVKEAIIEAVKTNNAAIIDAFHDSLVDELYQELVSRRKIEQL